MHSRLQRAIKRRVQTVDAGKDLDWATAEALAFGSLMMEGYDIRISGQDVGRGTFSQRYVPLSVGRIFLSSDLGICQARDAR